MAVEDATDLAVFFNTDDFGVAATWNGTAVTVIGFRGEAQTGGDGFGGVMLGVAEQANDQMVLVRASEVAAPAPGDTVVIAGVSYPVGGTPELDDGGRIWRVRLGAGV